MEALPVDQGIVRLEILLEFNWGPGYLQLEHICTRMCSLVMMVFIWNVVGGNKKGSWKPKKLRSRRVAFEPLHLQ